MSFTVPVVTRIQYLRRRWSREELRSASNYLGTLHIITYHLNCCLTSFSECCHIFSAELLEVDNGVARSET